MSPQLEICRKRGVVAVLASGVVISLTALTGGIAPAFAQPDTDDIVTTTAAPEPELTAPEREQRVERTRAPRTRAPQTQAPEIQAPQTQAPQTEAPQIQAPQTRATQTQPPETQAQITETQAPQTQAPVVQQQPAQEPEPEPEPEPQTQAPEPPRTSTAVQAPATPSERATTVERAPATSTAPRAATDAPATEDDEPESSADAPSPSAALVPEDDSTETPATDRETRDSDDETRDSDDETPASDDETTVTEEAADEEAADESETPTVSIEQAAQEIETVEPETLEAPAQDVQLARQAKPVVLEEQPEAAPEEDVAAFTNSIESSLKIPGLEIGTNASTDLAVQRRDVELVSNVRQWRRDWIEYDEFYRPIILNPFRAPVRIVYIYDLRPRFVYIPPLARIVIEAAQFAAYSFTAAVLAPINAAIDAVQAVTSIAVGSFLGGGFFPGVGRPLLAPPPVQRFDNVPVLVNYSNATYEPFRVRRIVDVGEDRVYGGRKVLLDGVTPVWGRWTQTAAGERQFEVNKTQQFPGLDAPAEAPLPGDYRLRLASDEADAGGLTGRDVFLMVAAGVIGTLGFGAIGLAFFLGRRRPEV